LAATYFNGRLVARAGNVYLQSVERTALTDANDGYLRLNNASEYTNGVYTPGSFMSGLWLKSANGISNNASSYSLSWGPAPSGSFGTCYLNGNSAGYTGLALNDGALNPVFMSNGSYCGIYVGGAEGKWLIARFNSSALAQSHYTIEAPGFNVSSSRKLKRETGRPMHVRDVLSSLRPILYRLLAEGKSAREQLGFIAEEVHLVCPWLSDGKTVAYDRLAVLLLCQWQSEHHLLKEAA
jgi:hypothetical protein